MSAPKRRNPERGGRTHWVKVAALAVASLAAAYAGATVRAEGTGTWSVAPALPTPRSELAAAALGGRLYVAGGIGRFGSTNAFEGLDLASGQWESLPPLPRALNHPAAAALQGKVWISGGYRNLLMRADVSQTWYFEAAASAWSRVADMPSARAAHALVAAQGRLFVVGGVGTNPGALWSYDPATGIWDTALAPLPTPREHLAAVALAGKLYALGGRSGNRNLAVVEVYDIAANRWERAAPMQTPRSGFTAGVIAGRVHVAGGESLTSGETFAGHEVYDPPTDRWSPAPPLPQARHGLTSAVWNGRWYVVGGATRAAVRTLISMSGRVDVFGGP